MLLAFACLAATLGGERLFGDLPTSAVRFYPLAVVVVAAGYGYLTRSRWFYATAAIALTASISAFGVRGYDHLRHHVIGLGYLAWGIVCFALAAAISAWKAGAMQQWLKGRLNRSMPQTESGTVKRE